MTTQTMSPNDVLMGGGDGTPSAKFPNPGDTVSGTIIGEPKAYQVREFDRDNPGGGAPRFFPSGDPIMAVMVDLATDLRDPQIEHDDGTRRLYLESKFMKEAVREAVKAAGASGLAAGGKLTVSFTHREDPNNTQSRKYWQAQYVQAANATLMAEPAVPQAPTPTMQPQIVQQPTLTPPAPQSMPTQQASVAAPMPRAGSEPQPAAGLAPADMARQLLMLGNPEATVAQMTRLDPTVVAQLHAAIATPQQ